ncbi:MAG TPA: ATP-binding protein [Caulobacteraceae bacterium]|nr:ATP-binding protein [Caulobacteraceae bacterium]
MSDLPSAQDDLKLDDLAAATNESIARQSLEVQSSVLRYALILFGVGLAVLAWAASYAPDGLWVLATFTIFALNWAAFYAVLDWAKRKPAEHARLGLRTRVHVLGGLLWAGAVAQMSALAMGAGPLSQPMLLLALGAAATCVFFAAPSLPSLLIVGPAAVVAPLSALFMPPAERPLARIALAATALGFALSLIFNRLLRRLFALAEEREGLMQARNRSLAEAKRLAKSKSDLIATLSQEVKTGLTGVAHVLAAAAGGERGQASREQLSVALESAEDLIAVLNATLDTEVAEAGELALARAPFDPARLVRDLVLMNRAPAAAKGIELGMHVDESLAEGGAVVGDLVRTRQILSNLIGNAVKYTLRGRIEVRLERTAADRIRVEVADTGPGLTAEELVRAFEPFRRIDRTCTGVPGAGLGLSLAKELAGLMGGQVTAESAPGVGSCFRLDMPYDQQATPIRRDEPSAHVHPLPRSRALKVLVADEDTLGAARLRGMLEKLGHHVLHARDGRRAYDLAQICEVDLIMLVGRMPEMDGAEAARAIRALGGPAGQTPIVAVIDGDGDEARAVIDAGADQVLRKPVSVSSVARALAEISRAKAAESDTLAVA